MNILCFSAGNYCLLTFLLFVLSTLDGFVSPKIYDKRNDFDFDIVNFPSLDGDVSRTTSYDIYISQLIRFARVSSQYGIKITFAPGLSEPEFYGDFVYQFRKIVGKKELSDHF